MLLGNMMMNGLRGSHGQPIFRQISTTLCFKIQTNHGSNEPGLNTPLFIVGDGAAHLKNWTMFFHFFFTFCSPHVFGICWMDGQPASPHTFGILAMARVRTCSGWPKDCTKSFALTGRSFRIGSGPTAKVRDKKNMQCAVECQRVL